MLGLIRFILRKIFGLFCLWKMSDTQNESTEQVAEIAEQVAETVEQVAETVPETTDIVTSHGNHSQDIVPSDDKKRRKSKTELEGKVKKEHVMTEARKAALAKANAARAEKRKAKLEAIRLAASTEASPDEKVIEQAPSISDLRAEVTTTPSEKSSEISFSTVPDAPRKDPIGQYRTVERTQDVQPQTPARGRRQRYPYNEDEIVRMGKMIFSQK